MAEDKSKQLNETLSQIEKQFGKGTVMRMGDREVVDIPSISTGSLGLDIALGIGGVPQGRVIEIFGPESSGLSNDELNNADYLVKIPTSKKFSSINLSHSVIIFCFIIFQKFSKGKFIYNSGYKSSNASKSQVNKFLKFIILQLDKKGFLQPDHKRKSMIRNINNIFHRLNLSEQEIHILLGIFSTLNGFNKKS